MVKYFIESTEDLQDTFDRNYQKFLDPNLKIIIVLDCNKLNIKDNYKFSNVIFKGDCVLKSEENVLSTITGNNIKFEDIRKIKGLEFEDINNLKINNSLIISSKFKNCRNCFLRDSQIIDININSGKNFQIRNCIFKSGLGIEVNLITISKSSGINFINCIIKSENNGYLIEESDNILLKNNIILSGRKAISVKNSKNIKNEYISVYNSDIAYSIKDSSISLKKINFNDINNILKTINDCDIESKFCPEITIDKI